MIDDIKEFYQQAWDGVRTNPSVFFRQYIKRLDDQKLHLIFIMALLIEGLCGVFRGGIARVFSIPISGLMGVTLATVYVFAVAKFFFQLSGKFWDVWRAHIAMVAILAPISMVKSLVGFLPVLPGLLALFYMGIGAYVYYQGYHHLLRLTLKQILALFIPVLVLLALLIGSGSDLFFGTGLLSDLGGHRPRVAHQLTKADLRGAPPAPFKGGERFVYEVKAKLKGLKGNGQIAVTSSKQKNELQVSVTTKMGKKSVDKKLTLLPGSHRDTLTARMEVWRKASDAKKISRYGDIMGAFWSFQSALMEKSGKLLSFIKDSFGGNLAAQIRKNTRELVTARGPKKISGRTGNGFMIKDRQTRIYFVRDDKLALPLLEMKYSHGKEQLQIRLKKVRVP